MDTENLMLVLFIIGILGIIAGIDRAMTGYNVYDSSCIDDDGGSNYYRAGSVKQNDALLYTDHCEWWIAGKWQPIVEAPKGKLTRLVEGSCSSGKPTTENVEIPLGKKCLNGALVEDDEE